jgi:DNA uptake protein ComE-like DNA-binding protein
MQAIPQAAKMLCPSCGSGRILKVHFRGTIARRVLRIIKLQPNRAPIVACHFMATRAVLGRAALNRAIRPADSRFVQRTCEAASLSESVAVSPSWPSEEIMRNTHKLFRLFLAVLIFVLAMPATATSRPARQSSTPGAQVDLNSASEKELESLPGVGAATAKKIIAGRPYASVDDLSKAGVSASTIKKITPLVTFGSATASPVKPVASKSAATAKPDASGPAGAKVDLNTASAAELKELPGVGDATAKKIMSGRPYSSIGDLSKAGVSASTISKITPLVSIGNAPATNISAPPTSSASNSPPPRAPVAPAAPAPSQAAPATTARTSPPAQASTAAAPAPAPGSGMVWVNTDSGVYHKEGTRYYGKTKNGKYMSEADAVKAGYRPAKKE